MNTQVIFVGGKPFMNYVTAVVMQFTTTGAEKVVVRSRGKFISRAVDVAEIVQSRFLGDSVEVNDIKIGSEDFKNKEGRQIRVSTIDIHLNKVAGKTSPIDAMNGTQKEETLSEVEPVEPAEPKLEPIPTPDEELTLTPEPTPTPEPETEPTPEPKEQTEAVQQRITSEETPINPETKIELPTSPAVAPIETPSEPVKSTELETQDSPSAKNSETKKEQSDESD